jgi:hypothetical protein
VNIENTENLIFVLSVDTEEEWDWSGPFPNKNFSVENVKEIPAFHNFCQEQGIKPTYFVDYAVAENEKSASILRALNKTTCEIGAHLHPWANPPFFDETSEFSSHVVNLPIDHVKQKLTLLLEKITQNIGVKANSFRTGRWGINGDILQLLVDNKISVDSSIYPLYNHQYFSCEHAPTEPYWPSFENTNQATTQQKIIEIPVTVGFNRTYFQFWQKLHRLFEKAPFTWLRLNGLLWHSKVLRKLYLSPELCDANDMIRLVKSSTKRGQKVLHMYLHSSSLIENVTGLNNQSNARENICQQIAQVIYYLQQHYNVKFCTISEVGNMLKEQGVK